MASGEHNRAIAVKAIGNRTHKHGRSRGDRKVINRTAKGINSFHYRLH